MISIVIFDLFQLVVPLRAVSAELVWDLHGMFVHCLLFARFIGIGDIQSVCDPVSIFAIMMDD